MPSAMPDLSAWDRHTHTPRAPPSFPAVYKHLDGLPSGAMRLADAAGLTAPQVCNGGTWTIGEVRGRLTRVQVCCGGEQSPFLRGVDQHGWFVDDAVAVGDALRRRAVEMCASGQWQEKSERTCGHAKHMYEDSDGSHLVSGISEVERVSYCITARHIYTYGALGLPGQPLEPARTLGHHEPIGMQGQERRAVVETLGCSNETMWAHLHRSIPLVLRGCVNVSSPRAMGWTARHLKRVAGDQRAPACDEPLADYIDRMNRTGWVQYRSCGLKAPQLLRDVAIPYALGAFEQDYKAHIFDKAVMWLGRANISPLHFDPNHNYMHQLAGQKRVLLIDPADSALLYADHTKSALGNSPVDVFKVDLDTYPLVAHATLWPVVLAPGDMLYIP